MPLALTVALIVFGTLIAAFLLLCLIPYFISFFNPRGEPKDLHSGVMTHSAISGNRFKAIDCRRYILSLKFEDIDIKSYEGRTLHGYFVDQGPDTPIVLSFHGWTGSAFGDLSCQMRHCHEKGMSILTVDQRGHGKSFGSTMTFGAKERFDVQSWSTYLKKRFPDRKVIVLGVSMGGATVICASPLVTDNVKGIISDCPFDNAFNILHKVSTEDIKIPSLIADPMLAASGLLYAHFNVFKIDGAKEASKSKCPILLIHGDEDGFVPVSMGRRIHNLNPDIVEYVEIRGAPHAYSCYVDPETYFARFDAFIEKVLR